MRRLLAVTLALVASGAFCAQASAGTKTPLSHAGRWLVGSDGRVSVLHGLNMVYKRAPYAPDAVGFGDDDAAFLASEGYNTVRVGLIYKAVEPSPGVYDDAYLARIEQTVDTLAKHGIVSLLDFHQDLFNERFEGEGWPDWAVQDDGFPAEPKAGFPANYLIMPALQRSFDHFWANDPGPDGIGLQDHYAAAWRHVAERFGANPAVLGYDLLNEPWPGTAWQQCATPAGCPVFDAMLSEFTRRMLTAIRTVDPDSIVWYEPHVLFNNGADTNLDDFGDPNMGMSWHDYCLTANEGGGGYSADCEASDSLVFANAEKRSVNTGDALLLTEFGATDDPAALEGVLKLADTNMMSWQEWHYCGCDDPTTTGQGDKQAIVFDPSSKKFSFAYTTARAADPAKAFGPGTETEIAVPARQYPDGYAVDVRGGAIRSAPGAGVLRVVACTATDRMAVSIVPGNGASQSSCAPPRKAGAARARLKVTARPRVVRRGRLVTMRVRVHAGKAAVRGAVVRVGQKRGVTGRRGVARVRVRFTRGGRRKAVARARGYKLGRAQFRVRR